MLANPLLVHRQELIQAAKKNDISYLALFGSYARGQQKQDSDIDFLISFDKKKGLFDLISVEQQFSDLLGVQVDLVTKDGLSKYIKPYIQDDIQLIYAKKS